VQGSPGTQGPGGRGFNYYDDDSGYTDTESTSLVDHRSEQFYQELGGDRKRFGWNGGADLGLLIIRLSLGAVFLAHGAQKLFGVLGGPGPDGFAQMLTKMGFQQASTLSLVTGGTELGAGALLVLGLFTPLAAAGILGVMANVVATGLGAGFFAPSGVEYPAVTAAMALGLMFIGPGRVALDYGRVWFRRPVTSGFICLVIAAGASAGVLLGLHH
jgi:putative oxidoreductase